MRENVRIFTRRTTSAAQDSVKFYRCNCRFPIVTIEKVSLHTPRLPHPKEIHTMRRILASSVLAAGLTFGGFCATPASAGIARTQLNHTIPEVPFNGVGLTEAIDFLRDVSGANLVVNWKALEEAGVNKDAPVNVRLHHVSLRKALETVLSEVAAGDKLGYDIDQNVITITTRELADSKMFTRVYPIQDLIMEIPDFRDAPDFSLNTTSNNAAQNPGGTAGGGGAGAGPTSPFTEGGKNGEDKGKSKEDRANEIIEMIKAVIQPEVWDSGKAAIRFWNGNLIITAPRSVQEAIGGTID